MAGKVLFLVAALFVISCSSGHRSSGHRLETTLENHNTLATAVQESGKCILFEGLPHQLYEKNVLEKELKTKQTILREGFYFYEQPLAMSNADVKLVTDLFSDLDSFTPWPGEKKCGGFHPDYCLEWATTAGACRSQICFGCGEVKVFGRDIQARWDLTNGAREKLKSILVHYRTNRPPPDSNMPGAK
jgi:hypothetical protein